MKMNTRIEMHVRRVNGSYVFTDGDYTSAPYANYQAAKKAAKLMAKRADLDCDFYCLSNRGDDE